MLVFLSPAKTLDFESDLSLYQSSTPYFIAEAQKVNAKLRRCSRKKLTELQSISGQLASLNYDRNQSWEMENHEAEGRQAALAFKGDVYVGLKAERWSDGDMAYAAEHLRILSGLYGVLKPNDLILPYRLEMGTKLPVGRRKNLYHFWGDKIKKYFREKDLSQELIVNLASNEYFKAVESAALKNNVLNVEFKDYSGGQFKVLSFFAKKARGLMADYIVRNRINDAEDLKGFNSENYYFDAKTSSQNNYVFLRDKQNA